MSDANLTPEDILVRVQLTPNPYALNFISNHPFKLRGKATFASQTEAEGYPLVMSLFGISGVSQVYLFQNQLTLTHDGALTTQEIVQQAESVIKTRMPIHNAAFETEDEKQTVAKPDRSTLSPELREVEEVLDRTIRPGLQADGGDVEVVSYKDDTISILYQGACGGCPSAMMGTLDAIQGILQQELGKPDLKVRPL